MASVKYARGASTDLSDAPMEDGKLLLTYDSTKANLYADVNYNSTLTRVPVKSLVSSEDVINALGYTPATEQTIPIFSFDIVDGDLIMYYSDGSSAPLAYIDSNGYLIMDLSPTS